MKYHQKYEKNEEKHSHSQLLSVCNLSSSKSRETTMVLVSTYLVHNFQVQSHDTL